MTDMTYDFCDGKGPVAAHRHPNVSVWVADTATVDGYYRLFGQND